MATSYSTVVNVFLRMVEEDRKFFRYFEVDDDTAMQIAQSRAISLLAEAVAEVQMKCLPKIDFGVVSENYDSFPVSLNSKEIYLLARIMIARYMYRDICKLKTMDVNFTGTEMRVFDPSNARKTFEAMYQDVCSENEYLMDIYKNTDRDTGEYNLIDFSKYDKVKGSSSSCSSSSSTIKSDDEIVAVWERI